MITIHEQIATWFAYGLWKKVACGHYDLAQR